MQLLLVIMAQILSLTSLLAFVLINYQLWRSVDSKIYAHLSDAFLEQEVTYDELYQSGMQSYTNEDWPGTIWFFERALQEFDYYRASLTECRLKCHNLTHISTTGSDALSEMKMFEAVFKKADCTKRCKLQKLGGRSERIDDGVTDKFLSMTPYSYLQFAYYKSALYDQAIAAAYTYLQWHPDDDVMQNNLDYYRNMHGIDEGQLVNIEEKPHHKHFLSGYKAYEDEDWSKVVSDMELALSEYWKANTQCRALCEGKYDNREFMDLYEAISNHYASTLYCKDQCDDWLARINGKLVEDYLPSHFHFLQFAYYKTDDLQKAIRNSMAYLLFHPKDEVMLQNLAFYENSDEYAKLDYVARADARTFHELVTMEMRLINFAQAHFWNDDAEEYLYPDKDIEEEEKASGTDYLGAEPINPKEVNLKQDEGTLGGSDGGTTTGGGDGDGVSNHESERRSAKYSRDLNHESLPEDRGDLDKQQGPDIPQGDASATGKSGTQVRSKILNGMKKIMQSLMGSSVQESEELLIQLARDPKSNAVRDKIKVAIEKMMASGEMQKAFPQDQLKNLIQGLSHAEFAETLGKAVSESEDPPPVENFDPEAVRTPKKTVNGMFLSNEARAQVTNDDRVLDEIKSEDMFDIKDYDPLNGLGKKEDFDWVNPPGYNAGAPGSPEDFQDKDEDDIELVRNHGDLDQDEDMIGDREFHPSDDAELELDVHDFDNNDNEDEQDEEGLLVVETPSGDLDALSDNPEDVCTPGNDCGRTNQDSHKYSPGNHNSDVEAEENYIFDEEEEEVDDGDKENVFEEEDEEVEAHKNGDEGADVCSLDGDDGDCSCGGYKDGECDEALDDEEYDDEEYDDGAEDSDDDDDDDDDEYSDDEEEEETAEEEEERMRASLTLEETKVQQMLDSQEEMNEETKEWMDDMMKIEDDAYYLLEDLTDVEVVMKDEELNGSNRVVVDGVAADQECGVLLQLLDGEAKTGNGYKGKPHPHTKYEHFEGLTVKDAVDAASKGRIPLLYPTVYMHLAERSRQFLQQHFRLKSHLFFSFTHLVCRQAEPGIMTAYSNIRRRDLSHPVHADNCNLDRRGRCHKKLPAFVWRDWSAILYLNQDFEGGEFIFAHFNQTAQSVVTPKCGRLVGFSAGSENLHGVKGVIQGRRCALAMWFTLDPRFREIEFFRAADHLNLLYEEEYSQQEYY